jgi:secondary thiamine-phosphate synthase enzyme
MSSVREISVKTERRTQVLDITAAIREALGNEVEGSAVLVFVPHTTAGVTINEHADPNVARDLESSLERIVDDSWPFKHWEPGVENASSHIRTALIGPQVMVPLDGGKLALGTWQGIFFCEFDGPRSRKVCVSVLR